MGEDTRGRFKIRKRPVVSARARAAELPAGLVKYLESAEAALAEPFKGVTADGRVVPGLYPIRPTGVSTGPITEAARAWLASLRDDQRRRARFALDSGAWRQWSNIHPFLMRHGVSLDEMGESA